MNFIILEQDIHNFTGLNVYLYFGLPMECNKVLYPIPSNYVFTSTYTESLYKYINKIRMIGNVFNSRKTIFFNAPSSFYGKKYLHITLKILKISSGLDFGSITHVKRKPYSLNG